MKNLCIKGSSTILFIAIWVILDVLFVLLDIAMIIGIPDAEIVIGATGATISAIILEIIMNFWFFKFFKMKDEFLTNKIGEKNEG